MVYRIKREEDVKKIEREREREREKRIENNKHKKKRKEELLSQRMFIITCNTIFLFI